MTAAASPADILRADKHACGHIEGTRPCRAAACLTFPVCRSHLGWWGQHNALALVQLGARIRNIGAPVFDWCDTMVDVRGGRGLDTLLQVPMRPDDLLVIADWLESRGEDATPIRGRLTSLVMARQTSIFAEASR